MGDKLIPTNEMNNPSSPPPATNPLNIVDSQNQPSKNPKENKIKKLKVGTSSSSNDIVHTNID